MPSHNNNMKKVLAFVGLSAVAAFQVTPPPSSHHRHSSMMSPSPSPSNAAAPELSPVDEMCIENVAEFCLHEQCDIEEYEALINQLEDQQAHFERHIAKVRGLLARLRDANQPEHIPEEVQEILGDSKETLANPPAFNGGESLGLW